jgi:hypothetical protein
MRILLILLTACAVSLFYEHDGRLKAEAPKPVAAIPAAPAPVVVVKTIAAPVSPVQTFVKRPTEADDQTVANLLKGE